MTGNGLLISPNSIDQKHINLSTMSRKEPDEIADEPVISQRPKLPTSIMNDDILEVPDDTDEKLPLQPHYLSPFSKTEALTNDLIFLRGARQTFRSIYGSRNGTQVVVNKDKFVRSRKHKASVMLDPDIARLFEGRARGKDLWAKARKHFMNQRAAMSLPEAIDQEMIHKGKAVSHHASFEWFIHPESLIKFLVYLIKFLGVCFNFFYIQIMYALTNLQIFICLQNPRYEHIPWREHLF